MIFTVKIRSKLISLSVAAAAALIAIAAPILATSAEGAHNGGNEAAFHRDSYPDGELIPYDKLPKPMVEKVAKLARKHTLYRDVKPSRFKSRLTTYEYLLDRLPLAAEITKMIKEGEYTVTHKGDGVFHGHDGNNMEGDFAIIYTGGGKRIYYGEGECRCSIVGTIKGKILMVLQYNQLNENGSALMENKLTAYMKVDSRFFGLITKTLGPLIGSLVDKKLKKFVESAKIVSEAIASDPEKVYKYIRESDEIDEAHKREFFELFVKN